MEKTLFKFLSKHLDPARPVLLALSGGPDSLALYHLLLKYKKNYLLHFAIAHIDHGWRKESAEEARVLEEMVRKEGIVFHLRTLQPPKLEGNLEAACRQARLAFFAQLCEQHRYQAVLLAHHEDDQAETVLKRVLEGASLPHLSGLRETTLIQGMTLWRPFLKVAKKELAQWLHAQGLQGFEDRTNLDPRFLRGRFRTRILPGLAADFGKEVKGNLARLGEEAAEFRAYLDGKLHPFLARIEKGEWGSFLSLSRERPEHPLEMEHLIRIFCQNDSIILSHAGLKTATQLALSKAADRMIRIGGKTLYIDRGRLFLPRFNQQQSLECCPLVQGTYLYGNWRVSVTANETRQQDQMKGWKAVWDGRCEVYLPEGDYHLGPPALGRGYPRNTSLSKWWTNAKVPAFLREHVPVVWEKETIRHEFLTGRDPWEQKNDRLLKISLVREQPLTQIIC